MTSKEARFDCVKRGPLPAYSPTVTDDKVNTCKACDKKFVAGEYVTIIPLGPGKDSDAREKCRQGRPYNAVAAIVHWACATGEE